MKTHYNDPEYLRKALVLQQQVLNVYPSAIPFEIPKGNKKKLGEKDDEETNSVPGTMLYKRYLVYITTIRYTIS